MNKYGILWFDLQLQSLDFLFERLIFKIQGTIFSACSLARDLQKLLS